jgi:hypothetical protein
MSIPDRFGLIISRWDVAQAMADEIHAWMPEYLAAGARQANEDPAKVVRPGKPIVRHTAAVRAEETAKRPAIVIVLNGATDRVYDPSDGTISGTLQLGVYVVVKATSTHETGVALHRLVAAVIALVEDRRRLGGCAQDTLCVDEDFTRTDIQSDRVLQTAELTFNAFGVVLGQRGAGPAPGSTPRPDPTAPLPPDETFESVGRIRARPVALDGDINDPDPS